MFVGVGVKVFVKVLVGVGVLVNVLVLVSVGVGVIVLVGVGVLVLVGVGVGVFVLVGVGVGVTGEHITSLTKAFSQTVVLLSAEVSLKAFDIQYSRELVPAPTTLLGSPL